MADNTPQVDPIIQLYIDLIKKNTGAFFRGIYSAGEPIKLPQSMLPALIVTVINEQIKTSSTAEDTSKIKLKFGVVVDMRDQIKDDKTLAPGWTKLNDIIRGRDPKTYLLKPTSLLYILRHNVNIDQTHQIWTDVDTMTVADFGLTHSTREEGWYALEATVTCTAYIVQIR